MNRFILTLSAAALLLTGCPSDNGGKKSSVNAACAGEGVDLTSLEGIWVKQILHNDGTKEQFPEFRLRIDGNEEGKLKISYVSGINLFEMTGSGNAEKMQFAEEVSPEDVKVFKEKNKDPNLGLRRMLTVVPNVRGCKIDVVERYETYVDGKRMEQRTGNSQYTMVPYTAGTELSFEECTAIQEIALGEGAKDSKAVAGTPVVVMSKGTKEDLGGESCKPVSDMFINGKLALKGAEGRIDGDDVIWEAKHAFNPPGEGANGYFVEIYRYAECDGSKKLTGVACNAVPVM